MEKQGTNQSRLEEIRSMRKQFGNDPPGRITPVHTALLAWITLLPFTVWSIAEENHISSYSNFSAPASESAPSLSSVASQNWWREVQETLQESEYHITEQKPSTTTHSGIFQASNRGHNLRFYFDRTGIRMGPRITGMTDWGWGLALQGIVTSQGNIPAAEAVRSILGNRIEYQRGPMTEWYVNNPAGLEQGFTLSEPVANGDHEITLVFAMRGNARVRQVKDDGLEVSHPEAGVVLNFGKLLAYDASGRNLPAHFAVQDHTLQIHVTTADAVYPVVIDPLATSPDWQMEGSQPSALFGWSIASAGDVNGDGYSDVIIGAPAFRNGEYGEGAAFVYLGSATGLDTNPAWQAEGNQEGVQFGWSVAGAGDINGDGYDDIMILMRNNLGMRAGIVFVYFGSSTGLATTTAVQIELNQAGFDYSVSSAGDVNSDGYSDIIIGLPSFDDEFAMTNGEYDEGAAFIYYGSASGLSTTSPMRVESNQRYASFGKAVASAGDINGDGYGDVIIGAPGFLEKGAAFVYMGSATGLISSAATLLVGKQWSAYFGSSVTSAGDVNGDGYSDVIVGAPWFNYGEINEGAAFIYLGSTTGLSTNASTLLVANQAEAWYGGSVASAGDLNKDGFGDIIVGAPKFDTGDKIGAAFVYLGSVTGLSTVDVLRIDVNENVAQYGVLVANAGDINSDGHNDVIIGLPDYQSFKGVAFAYQGIIDTDGDGLIDSDDNCPTIVVQNQADNDSDGSGDPCDNDDDNDGVPDSYDTYPFDATQSGNADSDGIDNITDTDDDNDGVPDSYDIFPINDTKSGDVDGDYVDNITDTDDDNDGVPDNSDLFPFDATKSGDADSDGIDNITDTDDDNDGVPDNADAFPFDPDESIDTDGDGTGNNTDTDDDNDGTPDAQDIRPLDPTIQSPIVISDFFSLQSGNQWTYLKNGNTTVVQQITAGSVINGVSTQDILYPDGIIGYFTNDINGLRVHRIFIPDVNFSDGTFRDQTYTFNPPLKLANAQAAPGEVINLSGTATATIEGAGTSTFTYSGNSSIGGVENITIPMGSFSALRMAFSINVSGSIQGQAIAGSYSESNALVRYLGPVTWSRDVTGKQYATYVLTAVSIDTDNDGINITDDNCPSIANQPQTDTDGDTQGDACDTDDDNDGVSDSLDAFPLDAGESQDSDDDTIGDNGDNCPAIANTSQDNHDGDTHGDICDSDDDDDGVPDESDAFSFNPNEAIDTDSDGEGNNMDTDDDNDGIPDGYEIQYGLNSLDAGDATQDKDSDGDSNLEEFQLGRNPSVNEAAVIFIINSMSSEE